MVYKDYKYRNHYARRYLPVATVWMLRSACSVLISRDVFTTDTGPER